MIYKTDLFGLILGGGRSSRMGQDKSLMQFHGVAQREYLFQLLSAFCDSVYLSCKNMEGIPSSLNPLPDKFELESPLNGILTAFSHNPTVSWITVPVDMPLVNEVVIDFLISRRDRNFVATCFVDSDGSQPEPLLTIWEKECAAKLLAFYNDGHISPRKFLLENKVNLVRYPDPSVLSNINSPRDLEDFQRKRKKSK